jgi:hypothetical protein
MKIGPADGKLGHGFAFKARKSFAGISIELAPWESFEIADPIGQEIIRSSDGALVNFLGMTMDFVHPYQVRVRLCP